MAEVLASDPRNAGIEMSAYAVGPDGLVVDLISIGLDKSRADVFRVLLQFAERVQSQTFADVVLAYRGEPRFLFEGTYFRELGQNYSIENPIYTMRTFPFALRRLDGSAAFPGVTSSALPGLSAQLEAFSQVHDEWYLAAEISRSRIAQPASEGTGETPTETPTAASSRYQTTYTTDPMTDQQEVVVVLEADEPLLTRHQGLVTPTLVVRCRPRDRAPYDHVTEAIVHFGFVVESDRGIVNARVRFDAGVTLDLTMGESTTSTAVFFLNSVNYLREMFNHAEMLVEVRESRGGSRVARFDLHGLEGALNPVSEHCNWSDVPFQPTTK